MRNIRDLERTLERTKEVLMKAAEPRCYQCFGPGDRCVLGRPGSECAIYDCARCRGKEAVSGRRKAAQ